MIEYLYEALRSEHGIALVTESGVERLRQKLYQLRKEDPALAVLSFVQSPTNPNNELWIVKRKSNAEG